MAMGSSGAGGSGDSAAGRRLTEERTRLGGDATARGSEGRPCHNNPQRESGSSLPDDESRTESSVQERIVVDAEELQAPHRLTSRDLVHLDEDTAGVSSRLAIGLRTAGAMNSANTAEALQAHLNTNFGIGHDGYADNSAQLSHSPGNEFSPPMSVDPEAPWLPPIQPQPHWHQWLDENALDESPPPIQTPQNPVPNAEPQGHPNRTGPAPRATATRFTTQASNGKKNTKAAIKVGALNIRGNGSTTINHEDNKWFKMNTIMNKSRLGILIVGEAHLNDERLHSIESVFARQLVIKFSKNPRTANADGVAFIVNKNLVKVDQIQTREIIPGRALILENKQHNGDPLSVLGVYAPNVTSENEEFWKRIQTFYETHDILKAQCLPSTT
ncbi:hypothetical protein B0H19DRAFT_1271844 [Mycena capillaripes]|nr:hypothetical protein B0H19DRAFT_1271844 [Mycena capillaripes]